MSSIATFALGTFWKPDAHFEAMRGVNTQVGYTGGTTPDPTFDNLGNHCEAVEVTYNEWFMNYEKLLDEFWKLHNPTVPQKTQYRSVIFYHDNEQREAAEKSKQEYETREGVKVLTTIEYAGTFYPAEEEHQQYLKKNKIPLAG